MKMIFSVAGQESKMCGILKHKILKYLKVKQVGVTLWIRETDQNQTENKGRKLLSLQTANGEQGTTNS